MVPLRLSMANKNYRVLFHQNDFVDCCSLFFTEKAKRIPELSERGPHKCFLYDLAPSENKANWNSILLNFDSKC